MRQATSRAASKVGRVPTHADLTIYQGDDIFVFVEMADPDGNLDLARYTPKAEIRDTPGGALVAEFNATVADATTIALHLPSIESTKLTADAAWDVQIADMASSRITTLVYGAIKTMREVTE